MKWSDVITGTQIKLKENLYSISEIHSDARYLLHTKAEVEKMFGVAYKEGDVFTFDREMENMWGDNGEIGIDIDTDVDADMFEIL